MKAAGQSVVARIRQMSPWSVDAVLGTCFLVAGLLSTANTRGVYESRDALAVALVLAGTVPYFARRAAPFAVFCVSVAAVAALFALGYSGGSLPMVIAVGAFTVGAYQPVRQVVLAAGLLLAALVVILLADSPEFGAPEFLLSLAVFGATILAGWTMQSRRLRLEALEREQSEAARRAAADERLRIAQELHDVVAHSLGVIAVQAGAGMHVIDDDPAEARRALEQISRTSRSSLAEIRRLLGMVRDGAPGGGYEPAPGLADLPRLAQEVGGAGVDVELDIPEDLGAVPPGVELAAYRIVQEALTNALRHAGARRATVRLDGRAGQLRIVVCDDGPGRNGVSGCAGYGLVGMRERVAVYGGSLEVGPTPDGGFRVDATIPYDQVRSR